jgi:hypothetical protein
MSDEQLRLAEIIADRLKPDTILSRDTISAFLDEAFVKDDHQVCIDTRSWAPASLMVSM